ncbi:MAG TPA: DHH family phosphoesterase [Candidatus Saccharimonadales bacterium]|nr:DHH family phosphoesterase [Candidatus Saccharimonadales bacterium]
MELTPKAQAAELIRASNKVLILTHSNPDGDAVGSSLALSLALKKLNKEPEVAFFGEIPEVVSFLPAFDQAKTELSASNEVVITIDTRQTGEDLRLGQKKLADKHQLMIVVTPQKGVLLPEDVTVTRSRPKYDLVIILDTSSVELLGDIYKDVPELFFETPTVNIDHHATNSYFGKVNWVDMTATSTAEMMVSLIESLGRSEVLLDADIATALLTGLLTDTNSFQNQNTTPKSLTVAAQLVAAGARQQEIIEKIFKTKKLATLKLWGKILSNLKEEPELKFAWTTVDEAEMKAAGVEDHSTGGFIDDLLRTAAGLDFVLLLKEKNGAIRGSLRAVSQDYNVAEIAQVFGGGGHVAAAGFGVEGTLEEKKAEIIEKVRGHVRPGQAASAEPTKEEPVSIAALADEH